MLDGVMLLWWILTVPSFFYVLGCRETLRGIHEEYVSVQWHQVLGSTMRCAAGDGIRIIVGSAIVRDWS